MSGVDCAGMPHGSADVERLTAHLAVLHAQINAARAELTAVDAAAQDAAAARAASASTSPLPATSAYCPSDHDPHAAAVNRGHSRAHTHSRPTDIPTEYSSVGGAVGSRAGDAPWGTPSAAAAGDDGPPLSRASSGVSSTTMCRYLYGSRNPDGERERERDLGLSAQGAHHIGVRASNGGVSGPGVPAPAAGASPPKLPFTHGDWLHIRGHSTRSPSADGAYLRCPERLVNGRTCWVREDSAMVVFATPDGRWTVGYAPVEWAAPPSVGYVTSAEATDAHPVDVATWEAYHTDGVWRPCALTISAMMPPSPYASPQRAAASPAASSPRTAASPASSPPQAAGGRTFDVAMLSSPQWARYITKHMT